MPSQHGQVVIIRQTLPRRVGLMRLFATRRPGLNNPKSKVVVDVVAFGAKVLLRMVSVGVCENLTFFYIFLCCCNVLRVLVVIAVLSVYC